MPKESNLELKVGAFVVAAVVALVGFVFSISDFSVFQKGAEYRVVFQFADGLKKGAPVRVAGVDTGHVRSLTVYYDTTTLKTMVRVGIWLRHGTTLSEDSRVFINQLGLLGEKYLEVVPGASGHQLDDGGSLRGDDPVALETILNSVGGITGKIDAVLTGINQRLLTETNTRALSESLQNVAAITGAVRSGEGSLGLMLRDRKLYDQLTAIAEGLNRGEGTIGMFLKDKSIYQNLDELTADLKANPWKLFYRPKGK